MKALTKQELHNLAMNIVGKKLQQMGYEFVAVNSQLKRHPQFVLYKKANLPYLYWSKQQITFKILENMILSGWKLSKSMQKTPMQKYGTPVLGLLMQKV